MTQLTRKGRKEIEHYFQKIKTDKFDIVDYLVQANGWVHIDELAKTFKVSTRAIKIDLAFLRDKIDGLDILFSTNGVRIELPEI